MVDFLVDILRANAVATDFCRDLLHISPVTHVSTALSTPPPSLITITVVNTDIDSETVASRVTGIFTVTDIATATDVILSTSELEITETSTVLQISMTTATVTDTTTDDVPFSTAELDVETATAIATEVLTAFAATTFFPGPIKAKREEAMNMRAFLKKYDEKLISKACRCLDVKPETITVATTTVLPQATVCKSNAPLYRFFTLTSSTI